MQSIRPVASTSAITKAMAQPVHDVVKMGENLVKLKKTLLELGALAIETKEAIIKDTNIQAAKKRDICTILTEEASLREAFSKLIDIDEFRRLGIPYVQANLDLVLARLSLDKFFKQNNLSQLVDDEKKAFFCISKHWDEFSNLSVAFINARKDVEERNKNHHLLMKAVQKADNVFSIAYPLRARLKKLSALIKKFEDVEKNEELKSYVESAKEFVEKELFNVKKQGKSTINDYTVDDINPTPEDINLRKNIIDFPTEFKTNSKSDLEKIELYNYYVWFEPQALAHFKNLHVQHQLPNTFYANAPRFSESALALFNLKPKQAAGTTFKLPPPPPPAIFV